VAEKRKRLLRMLAMTVDWIPGLKPGMTTVDDEALKNLAK
jgi:hypothetical protein